jgi:hypothetical protein
MQYILDFDRVLFDTDSFIQELETLKLDQFPRDQTLLDKIEAMNIKWKNFIYPGVEDFLRQHGSSCAIVSSYISRNRLDNDFDETVLSHFQNEKIIRSGLSQLVSEVVVTGTDKTTALKDLFEGNAICLDDEIENVNLAQRIGYKPFLMRTQKNNNSEVPQTIIRVDSFKDFVNSFTS